MGTSASNWSKQKISVNILFVLVACLVLSSPAWIFQASGAVPSSVHTVDASGQAGSYASLDLDSKGNPGISYFDSANSHLKYTRWNGTNWDVQTVDSEWFNGLHNSIAFDLQDNPHISYMGEQGALKHAYWNGTAWNIQTVAIAGSHTSIAIDAKGYPHISYFSVQDGADLRYATWNGSCWNIETVDSQGIVGEFTSLKLDNASYPHISYWDVTNKDLKIAWCDNTSWHIQTVDSSGDSGAFTSLALSPNGSQYISYFDNASRDLKFAKSDGSNWTVQTIESDGDVGTDTSLALDSHENPHISYTDTSHGTLKYASWNSSNWTIQTLRYAGLVGELTGVPIDQTSLRIDKEDNAHIAYYDCGNYCLKYLINPDESGFVHTYIQPTATLNVNLNTLGVGQAVDFSMSLAPRPPLLNDRFVNITVTITQPNGTILNIGPFTSDSDGVLYVSFVPTQIGNYTLQMNFPGQAFTSIACTYFSAQSKAVTLNITQQSTVNPSPTPTPTPNNSSTSASSSQGSSTTKVQTSDYMQPWQNSESNDYTPNQPSGNGDIGEQQDGRNWIAPGPFPVVETAAASAIAFSVCIGVILILKRWE